MTPVRFLETNILVRHIAGDNEIQSPLSTALLEQVSHGRIDGLISMTVMFETVYVLTGIYRLDRVTIVEALLGIVGTPGIRIVDCEAPTLDKTLSLYLSIPRLSFADCYHAALSLAHCGGEMYTFDRDFDRVPDLTRLEPGDY